MALQKIDFSNLNTMDLAISSNNQLGERINQQIQAYHTIDISVAMTNLANIGKILKLAYAGSKGFPCSTSTIEILSKYQSMIKNSFITSASFVDGCLSALKYHKMAVLMAEKDKFDSSITMIEKCSELANKMATKSGELVNEAKSLCDLSETALLTAHNDENVSNEEKERITQMINESKAKTAELEQKTKMLYEQIEDVKRQQAETSKKADGERDKELGFKIISHIMAPMTKIVEVATKPFQMGAAATSAATSVISAISGPIFNFKNDVEDKRKDVKQLKKELEDIQKQMKNNKKSVKGGDDETEIEQLKQEELRLKEEIKELNNSIKELLSSDENTAFINQTGESHAAILEEKERLIMKIKNDLQKEEREANAELAKVGELLKGLKVNEQDLSASIYSLELSIKALGKIKTTFEHTRQFWLGVESHCKKLTDIGILKELNSSIDFKDDYIDELKASGLSWLALGKINYNAQLSIREVDKQTDNMLCNLPTRSEALSIVQNEADIILNSLQNERSILDTQ